MGSEGSPDLYQEIDARLRGCQERAGLSVADVCSVYSILELEIIRLEEGHFSLHSLNTATALMILYRCSGPEVAAITETYEKAFSSSPFYRKLWRSYIELTRGALEADYYLPFRVFINYRRLDEGAFAG